MHNIITYFKRGFLYRVRHFAKQGAHVYQKHSQGLLPMSLVLSSHVWNTRPDHYVVTCVARRTIGGDACFDAPFEILVGGVKSKAGEGGSDKDGEYDCCELHEADKSQTVNAKGNAIGKKIHEVEKMLASTLRDTLSGQIVRQIRVKEQDPNVAIIPRGSVISYKGRKRWFTVLALTNNELQKYRPIVSIVLLRPATEFDHDRYPVLGPGDGLMNTMAAIPQTIRTLDFNSKMEWLPYARSRSTRHCWRT